MAANKLPVDPARHACAMCADLNLSADSEWAPSGLLDRREPELDAMQQYAQIFQSGGCILLLEALLRIVPQAVQTPERTIISQASGCTCALGIQPIDETFPVIVELFTEDQMDDYDAKRMSQATGRSHVLWPVVRYSICDHDLTSNNSLDFVRRQISSCQEEHSLCSTFSPQADYLPKRLLDLGGDHRQSRSSMRASAIFVEGLMDLYDDVYACLSHRWTTRKETLMTTRNTIQQNQQEIPFESLGTVYQDAVIVSRRLKVRYLWIDSMCIVQDDPQDWQTESEAMSKIYGGAYLTLSQQCDGSSSVSIGALPVKSHVVCKRSSTDPVYARENLPHVWTTGHTNKMQREFSLLGRGWIYKERLLFRRVIHIFDQEISWECGQTVACQCTWRHKVEEKKPTYFAPSARQKFALLSRIETASSHHRGSNIRDMWTVMVSEYSGLALTKAEDRLPAIRGCAARIEDLVLDRCIYGLWTESLLEDLLWFVDSKAVLLPRPVETSTVPTWSWASVAATIAYNDHGHWVLM